MIEPGRYYIQFQDGRVLEASTETYQQNGARIQLAALRHTLNQLWDLRTLAGGQMTLVNVGAQRVLDAHAPAVNQNGCTVQLWQYYAANTNQRWAIQPLGDGRYTIRCAASATNKVLSRAAGPANDIQLGDFANPSAQGWSFVASSDRAVVQQGLVDLRPNQTPIRNQGNRGSCTYFGTTAALEAAYKKAGHGTLDLSEEFWSIMGKALYIHPDWNDVTHANYRENQFATTQGGGSTLWYASGLRLSTEADVPYRSVDRDIPNWRSLDQREANTFNFSLFTPSVLRPRTTYGARTAESVPGPLNAPDEYERLLRLGIEVSIGLNGHNVLLVGFDKRDAARPCFFVKNSYGPDGADPVAECEKTPYSEILPSIYAADYVLDVIDPGPWPELAFLGRWKLNFDGHRGTLDIYHVPGVGNLRQDAPGIRDRRIGVFYDGSGRAFRVNGRMKNRRLEFCLDMSQPNLPWDQLSGRSFVYQLNDRADLLTGYHKDPDGNMFGGYATKADYVSHRTPSRPGFAGLANGRWHVTIGRSEGIVTFGPATATCCAGAFASSTGSGELEANLREDGSVSFWLRGTDQVAIGRFLNHEQGVICGQSAAADVFLAAARA